MTTENPPQEEPQQAELLPAGRRMVSKSTFAAEMGVSPAAVSKALKAGRIKATTINGREYLDADACAAQWAMSTRPRSDSVPPPPRGTRAETDGDSLNRQLKEAALVLQRAKAEAANLALDREAGLLVERVDSTFLAPHIHGTAGRRRL